MTGSDRLEVAIAAMALDAPDGLVQRLGLAAGEVDVLIINQCPDRAGDNLPPDVDRALGTGGRLRMRSFSERGLSRSRNRALQLADARYLLLGDQDLQYLPGFSKRVLGAFSAHANATGISFQFIDADTGAPTKRYPPRARTHDALSIGAVSSVELALDRTRLGDGPRFDERFGLGARYPSGEEAVFLSDLRAAGHVLRYQPVPICMHPGDGSGHRAWDAQTLQAKGAMLRRLFPRTWPAAVVAFGASKFGRFGATLGPQRYFAELWRGARDLSR